MRQALESTPVDPASGIQATSMIPTRDINIIGPGCQWLCIEICAHVWIGMRGDMDRHATKQTTASGLNNNNNNATDQTTASGLKAHRVCSLCAFAVCGTCCGMAAIRARGRSVISNGRLEVAEPKLKLNRPSRTLWRARAWGGVGGGFMNIFEWLHTWYRWDYLSGIYGMSMRHGCPTFPGHFDSRLCGCHGGSAVWLPWRFRLCGCHGGSAVWLRQRFPV